VQYSNIFDKLYSRKTKFFVVNIADFEINDFNNILAKMNNPITLTCSIHRNVYSMLTQIQFSNWINFLVSKKLFPNEENARYQLNTFRIGVDNGSGIRL
jgi:hypothetical protein